MKSTDKMDEDPDMGARVSKLPMLLLLFADAAQEVGLSRGNTQIFWEVWACEQDPAIGRFIVLTVLQVARRGRRAQPEVGQEQVRRGVWRQGLHTVI